MDAPMPSVDHSIWRYYHDGGKGFAARGAEKMRSMPRMERLAEKEKLKHAVAAVKREKISGAKASRRAPNRSPDDAAADRMRQALLGTILKNTNDGEHPSIPLDEKMVKAQIETMSSETLQKMARCFSSARVGDGAATSSEGTPMLHSLDEELAKRGISLQLSGKVNNVYLSGANSSWAVNASAGSDQEFDKGVKDDKGKPYRRYNNFGQTIGRLAKNFLNGH